MTAKGSSQYVTHGLNPLSATWVSACVQSNTCTCVHVCTTLSWTRPCTQYMELQDLMKSSCYSPCQLTSGRVDRILAEIELHKSMAGWKNYLVQIWKWPKNYVWRYNVYNTSKHCLPSGCLGVHRHPISTHIVHIRNWFFCVLLDDQFISAGASTAPKRTGQKLRATIIIPSGTGLV